MKKFYAILFINIAVGIILAYLTACVFVTLRDFGGDESFQWLTNFIPAFDVGYVAIFVLLAAIDVFWAGLFMLWLIKKKLHLQSDTTTLYLP